MMPMEVNGQNEKLDVPRETISGTLAYFEEKPGLGSTGPSILVLSLLVSTYRLETGRDMDPSWQI